MLRYLKSNIGNSRDPNKHVLGTLLQVNVDQVAARKNSLSYVLFLTSLYHKHKYFFLFPDQSRVISLGFNSEMSSVKDML